MTQQTMKYTSTCKTCKKVFDKNSVGVAFFTQTAADAAVRMHIGRVHKKSIPTAKYVRSNLLVTAGSHDAFAAPVLVTDRRTKAWREQNQTHALRATRKTESGGCKFCPGCGLNLAIANTALAVALRHS
jgi:hypothetical protein